LREHGNNDPVSTEGLGYLCSDVIVFVVDSSFAAGIGRANPISSNYDDYDIGSRYLICDDSGKSVAWPDVVDIAKYIFFAELFQKPIVKPAAEIGGIVATVAEEDLDHRGPRINELTRCANGSAPMPPRLAIGLPQHRGFGWSDM